jgi:hypothetical protein
VTESKDNIVRGRDADIGKAVVAQEERVGTMASKGREGQPSWAMVIVIAVVVSLLSSSASVAVYDRFFAQKVVTANISKFVVDQRDLYFQGKLDGQQYVNNLNNFIALLKNQPKNRVVILEDVVAANAERLEPR